MPVDKAIIDEQLANLEGFDSTFAKTELNHLHNIIHKGEVIQAYTSTIYEGKTWLLILTQRRLILLDKNFWTDEVDTYDFSYSNIDTVTYHQGFISGTIMLEACGMDFKLESISLTCAKRISEMISDFIEEEYDEFNDACSEEDEDEEEDTEDDEDEEDEDSEEEDDDDKIISNLERLGRLKQEGILTEEEFLEQKRRILGK